MHVIYSLFISPTFKYGIYKSREVKKNPVKKLVLRTCFFIGFFLPPSVYKSHIYNRRMNKLYVLICVCMFYLCSHACIHIPLCMFAVMYACIHECRYVFLLSCMHEACKHSLFLLTGLMAASPDTVKYASTHLHCLIKHSTDQI